MSTLDLLIQSARDYKVARANNPRAVQTVQQRQVEVRNNPGALQKQGSETAKASKLDLVFAAVPGGKATVVGLSFLLVGGFVVKKVL